MPHQHQTNNRLRELREAKGLPRHEIGSLVKRDTSIIARYERGDGGVPDDVKRALADFYGVTVDYLMGWDRDPASQAVPEAAA